MPSKGAAKTLESATRMGTRSENVNAHPGIVVANLKRKRRTKAEIQADEEERKRKKEAEQERKARGLQRIAGIENDVVGQDTSNLVTPKPKRQSTRKSAVERPVSELVPGGDDGHTDGEEPSEFEEPKDNAMSDLTSVLSEEEEEHLPKKKKVKESTRGAIQAVRQVGNTLQEIDGTEPAIDKPHWKKAHAKRFGFYHMVLTLDETTLFYYTMTSSEPASRTGTVKNWAAKTDVFSAPKSKNSSSSFSSRSRAGAPSLTYGSSRSTKSSAISNHILISSDRTHVNAADNDPVNDGNSHGGFDDEDEIHGAERDEALSSPRKGKVRATSQVSCIVFLTFNP